MKMFIVKFYQIPLIEGCNKAHNEVDILCYLSIQYMLYLQKTIVITYL
jgi:hypothetical protein